MSTPHQRMAEAMRPDFVIGGLASDFTEQEFDAYTAAGAPPAFTDCADCGRLVVFTSNLAPREPMKVCPECGIKRLNGGK